MVTTNDKSAPANDKSPDNGEATTTRRYLSTKAVELGQGASADWRPGKIADAHRENLKAANEPQALRYGDKAVASLGLTDKTRVASAEGRPISEASGKTWKLDSSDYKKIDAMLDLLENAKLKTQVEALRTHIADSKQYGDATDQRRVKDAALLGLDQMLLRGTDGYKDAKEGTNPRLKQEQIAKAVDSLANITATPAEKLSPTMGDSVERREKNRDLAVSQYLRNNGDTRGVMQTGHETCLLDGKIKDEYRRSPETAAKFLQAAMTSQDGTVTMDGRKVRINDSFMQPDQVAAGSTGGADAYGMSTDVRMLTGLYANSRTQSRGETFVMSDTSERHCNDRLLKQVGGKYYLASDGGKAIDSPALGAEDSARLNEATGDGGIIAANPATFKNSPPNSPNFRSINTADGAANLVDKYGSIQIGLDANVLWTGHKIGGDSGGHLTSVTAVERDASGKPNSFYIEDTNQGKSGWYSADQLMAAVNDTPGRTAPKVTEPGEPKLLPGTNRFDIPQQPGSRPVVIDDAGRVLTPDNSNKGLEKDPNSLLPKWVEVDAQQRDLIIKLDRQHELVRQRAERRERDERLAEARRHERQPHGKHPDQDQND